MEKLTTHLIIVEISMRRNNSTSKLLSSSWSHPNISSAMDLLLFYWRMKRTKCNYICQLGYSELPHGDVNLIDLDLINKMGIALSNIKVTRMSLLGHDVRAVGRIKQTIQCVHKGRVQGTIHLQAKVVRDLYSILGVDCVASAKTYFRLTGQEPPDPPDEEYDDEDHQKDVTNLDDTIADNADDTESVKDDDENEHNVDDRDSTAKKDEVKDDVNDDEKDQDTEVYEGKKGVTYK